MPFVIRIGGTIAGDNDLTNFSLRYAIVPELSFEKFLLFRSPLCLIGRARKNGYVKLSQ